MAQCAFQTRLQRVFVRLFRLVDCAAGKILIDGVDIAGVGLAQLRQAITVIPQDPLLMEGTVAQNLDPFGRWSPEEIGIALGKASLVHWPRLYYCYYENGRVQWLSLWVIFLFSSTQLVRCRYQRCCRAIRAMVLHLTRWVGHFLPFGGYPLDHLSIFLSSSPQPRASGVSFSLCCSILGFWVFNLPNPRPGPGACGISSDQVGREPQLWRAAAHLLRAGAAIPGEDLGTTTWTSFGHLLRVAQLDVTPNMPYDTLRLSKLPVVGC